MDISRVIGCVLLEILLFFLQCSIAIRTPHSDRSRHINRISGEWGDWGAWSRCSVECGTGISSRTRRCEHPLTLPLTSLALRSDDSVECDGGGREIRVCNRHRCPPNVTNVREKQCRKFNARVFNGKKYNWEPYINPNNKCELTCRAKGQHFYARLANRVGDGTPCGLTDLAVCIHRKCITVGCDGLVGSNATLDKCGVCKGDNSTCRTISGVFTRPDLPHGYSKIITIPAGSTNVNITELRQSTNYLSLKTQKKSILNGNWAISSSGDYDAAGTTFKYQKESLNCPGECIFSKGPTNETVEVMMLVYHRNPGVTYSFNVPVDVTDTYFKNLISQSEGERLERFHKTTLPTTTSSFRVGHGEPANLELPDPTEEGMEVPEVEDVTEAFREELAPQSENHVNFEEGVQKRPHSRTDNTGGESYGDRGYEFQEGTGQTVVLKANAGSWFHRPNDSESQSQDGPKFVLSELGSRDETNQADDTSLEVVEGESVLREGKGLLESSRNESNIETQLQSSQQLEDKEDADVEDDMISEESSEEAEGGISEEDISEEGDISSEESSEEESPEETLEPVEALSDNSKDDGKSILAEDLDDEEEVEEEVAEEVEDVEEKKVEEEEEPYDTSRGDETLGLGDGYRDPVRIPVPTRSGYKLPSQTDPGIQRSTYGARRNQEPPSTRAAPVSTEQYSSMSSTVPQRDSRFRTYSRTLGQSDVRPTVKRIGRPPPRRNVRIPKYSQSFTFRERYKALINAQRKRLYRQRQQALGGTPSTTSAPINRRIGSGASQGQRQRTGYQRTHTDRARIHHNRHRHHHHQTTNRPALTTDPTPVRIDNVNGQSQGLHIGQTSESRFSAGRTRGRPGIGSSVTLKANIDSNKGRPVRPGHRDQRLSTGYQAKATVPERSNLGSQRGTGGHQPSVNSRVRPRPFDRAIDPRQRVPDTNARQQVDSRTIVDETLALGQFNRRKDRRIVIPQEPQITNQKPVINSRPIYEQFGSGKRGGEPLTKYTDGVDPISGLPSIVNPNRQALRGGNSIVQNAIPTVSRQNNQVATGGTSNEILGSNYVWRVSGFTDCTKTCGGGVQQTVVVCVDTRTQAVVTDENCGGLQKPTTTAVTCNTRPCPASWDTSPWSSCSSSCGQGVQSRTVTCKSRVSATLDLTMPDSSCNTEKPRNRQACELTPCYKWIPGNWSKCSSRCGPGTRRRDVTCTDASDNLINSQLCRTQKPSQEEACDMGSCGKGWFFTDWPTECPASCGEGTMQRKTLCAGDEGEPIDDDRCDQLSRPAVEKTCNVDTPCGGNWFIGEWSNCNATCGYAIKSRDVVCVKNLPGSILAVVTEDNCKGKEKPETEENCDLNQCQSEWYMTSWSQCTKTCGTGHRTREVKCLDPYQQPSGDCPTKGKPRTREACNTQSCLRRPKPTRPSGGECKDSFSQCKLVKKARLCQYGYYAKMCCLSCSSGT